MQKYGFCLLDNMNITSLLSLQPQKDNALSKLNPSFVLISSDRDNNHKIKDKISNIQNVSQVVQVEGMYDFVIRLESDSIDGVKEIIANKIRNIDGVRTCLSLLGDDPRYSQD